MCTSTVCQFASSPCVIYTLIYCADILVTTPSRLVHMLSQEPPAIHLSRSFSLYTTLVMFESTTYDLSYDTVFVLHVVWSGWYWTRQTSCLRTVPAILVSEIRYFQLSNLF